MHFREALTHLHSPLHGFRHPQRNNSEHDATASRSNVHSGSQVRVDLFHHPQASGEGNTTVDMCGDKHMPVLQNFLRQKPVGGERVPRKLGSRCGHCFFVSCVETVPLWVVWLRWLRLTCIYLGHRLDAEGIHPTNEKLLALQQAPNPTCVTELRSYVGLVNYYHKFLKNVSAVLKPLYELLQSDTSWHRGLSQQRAFEASKALLQSSCSFTTTLDFH